MNQTLNTLHPVEYPLPLDSNPASAMSPLVTSAARAARPTVSCVVPCRNEARNLKVLLPLIRFALTESAKQWEVILVDDGSTDDTVALLRGWATRPGFRVIELARNFGKEAALTAGLQAAAGDVVITMDADLQHPPSLIPTLLAQWQRGADVAYAARANRDDEGFVKRWGARWFYALVNATDRFVIPPHAGDFRLMDRVVVDALLALPERNRLMKGLCAWVGFKTVPVPYVPPPRRHGRSSFNARALLRLSIDGITAFTTWPLRAVSLLGLCFAVAGFGYGGYLTARYLMFGNPVSGWTTIVVGQCFLFGMVMVSLGVVGEYVGRIFEEVKQRPLFVVRSRFGSGLEHGR